MQLLEYPLFGLVGPKEFPRYHDFHNRSLPILVMFPTLLAFISSIVLLWIHPAILSFWLILVVVICDLGIIVSTVVSQAPIHVKLDREGFSADAITTLVQTNWIRTILWIVSSLLLLWMVDVVLISGK